MKTLTTNLSRIKEGVQVMMKESKDPEIVLIPLTLYQALLNRLEELEDIRDHIWETEAYRRGEGRSFKEFVKEHRSEFDI